ncbi:hypothetical protein PMAYCL1PPCAC_26815, partial [Pristionchus mayeri]
LSLSSLPYPPPSPFPLSLLPLPSYRRSPPSPPLSSASFNFPPHLPPSPLSRVVNPSNRYDAHREVQLKLPRVWRRLTRAPPLPNGNPFAESPTLHSLNKMTSSYYLSVSNFFKFVQIRSRGTTPFKWLLSI